MYPEEEPAPAPADYGAETSFKSRFSYHLEGLIPLILIIIIAFVALSYFNIIKPSTPVIGGIASLFGAKGPMQVLIIGNPSPEFLTILDEDRDLVKYIMRDATSLNVNPTEQIAPYDLIVLDQSNQPNKAVSRQLGEAIENFVRTGGALIVIKDSGIYREYGLGRAPDVIGWKATFGDIIPVECGAAKNNIPTCTQRITVVGRIVRNIEHPIMQGIEQAPALPTDPPYTLETFPVDVTGTEIASIKTGGGIIPVKYYPAIVVKRFSLGLTERVIYFNYDPAFTRGIFENTLEYLAGRK